MKRKFTVTWGANVRYRSFGVEAESAEEAENMAMDNDLPYTQAEVKDIEPIAAEAEEE